MEKIDQIKKDALGFPARARSLIVHNNETLGMANNFILRMKEMMAEVASSYDPIISHAKAEKKKYSDPLKEAQQIARIHVTSYLEDQAEIQRKADEKVAKEEEKRQKKEELLLERVKKYSDVGMKEEADAVIDEIPLPAVVEIPPAPKPEGLILKHILDTERITQLVESSKGLIKIPGIEIYKVLKWRIIDRKIIPKGYYKSSISTREKKIETEIVTQGKPEDA